MELLVQFLVVTLSPLLVAAVTKHTRSSTVKGLVLLAINAGVALGEAWLSNGGILTDVVLWDIVTNFTMSVGLYFGLYRDKVAPAVAHKTDELHIGL